MIGTIALEAADGAATAARFRGSSGPGLVFVHGVGSTAAIWDRQLEAFGDEYRAYAVELRGNGVPKPEPPPAMITRHGYALDVLAVCDEAGLDRFTVVGCSLGGVVAFELWQHAAHRISAMAIVGSFAAYPNAAQYAAGIARAVEAAGNMPAFARERAGKMGLPPERLTETIEQMSVKTTASYLAATQATWTGDYSALLPAIDVPVLVTCGERDAIAPAELSRAISDAIPGARFATVPDAGHVANADNAPAFDRLLREFLP